MMETLLRRLLRLSTGGKATVAVVVIAVIGGSAIAVHAAISHRSTAGFCKVYSQEKAKYINATNSGNVGVSLSAVLSIPELFDKLDKVAPPEIEPDVADIRDRLDSARDAAGGASPDNPFAGLGSSIVAGFASAQSWQNVSNYIDRNCPKTPEEQAALKAEADKEAFDRAQREVYNAVVAINGDVVNNPSMDSVKPLGLTSQMDSDLQTMRDAITEQRKNSLEPTTVRADCENLRSVLTYDYNTMVADIKSVKDQGWPPTIDTGPSELNPTTLGQHIGDLQNAIDRYRQLGGDPAGATPNSESPDQTIAKAQALQNGMTAEIEDAKIHTPDWYLAQLRDIYQHAHLGGVCG